MSGVPALGLGFWAAAVLIFGGAQPLVAQSSPGPAGPPPSFGQVRLGVLTITPALKLVNLGIDTNVFNVSGTERRPPDFTTTVQPQVETLLKTAGLTLRVTSLADFIYYRKYASERAINPRIDTTIEQRLSSRFALYGEIHLGFSRSRTGLEIDARARQRGVSGFGGARLQGHKVELDLRGGYAQTRYAQNARFLNVSLADSLDRTSKGVTATMLYHATPYTAFTVGGDEVLTRFRFSPARDIDSNRVFAGLRFSPRAVISGDAELGYRLARPLNPLTPAFSGFTPSVGLSYRLLDTTTFTAAAHRDLDFSFQPDRPYFIYVTYEGSVRQAIAHLFDVGTAVQYSVLTYRTFTTAAVTPQGPVDRVRSLMGTLGFPATKRMRVELYGGEWERLSAERPYRTLRGGVQVTIGKTTIGERGVFVNGLGR